MSRLCCCFVSFFFFSLTLLHSTHLTGRLAQDHDTPLFLALITTNTASLHVRQAFRVIDLGPMNGSRSMRGRGGEMPLSILIMDIRLLFEQGEETRRLHPLYVWLLSWPLGYSDQKHNSRRLQASFFLSVQSRFSFWLA